MGVAFLAREARFLHETINAEPVPISDHIVQKAAERMRRRRSAPDYGLMEWQGLLRTVERGGANYRC